MGLRARRLWDRGGGWWVVTEADGGGGVSPTPFSANNG